MVEIPLEYFGLAKKNIESNQILLELFGRDWIYSLFEVKNSDRQHPIFWHIVDNNKCQKLVAQLTIINENCKKIYTLVKKLKTEINNFYSFISEIEVLSYYYSKLSDKYEIEYEPDVYEKGKKSDIRINVEGEDYFLDVIRIKELSDILKMDDSYKLLEEEIEKIEGNIYHIIICITPYFSKMDIPKLKDIVEEIIIKKEIKGKKTIYYPATKNNIAEVTIYENPDNCAYVNCLTSSCTSLVDYTDKTRKRILGKVNQLPANSKNVVVVDMSEIYAGFHILEDVCLGDILMKNMNIDSLGDLPRDSNGVANYDEGKYISMIIGFEKNDYSTRKFYVNTEAVKPINKSLIESIF